MDLYRVFWKPKNSDIIRWGDPTDYDTAKAWVKK